MSRDRSKNHYYWSVGAYTVFFPALLEEIWPFPTFKELTCYIVRVQWISQSRQSNPFPDMMGHNGPVSQHFYWSFQGTWISRPEFILKMPDSCLLFTMYNLWGHRDWVSLLWPVTQSNKAMMASIRLTKLMSCVCLTELSLDIIEKVSRTLPAGWAKQGFKEAEGKASENMINSIIP